MKVSLNTTKKNCLKEIVLVAVNIYLKNFIFIL